MRAFMTNRIEKIVRVFVWVLSMTSVVYAEPETDEAESLDDPKTEAAAFEISQRTMSPFCPGRTLADCPSDKAAAWRQDIRRMLVEGKSAGEIRRVLNERSGLNLSGAPESSLGWALPAGMLVGAVGILALVIVRFRQRDDAPPGDDGRDREEAGGEDTEDDEREDDEREDDERARDRDAGDDEDRDVPERANPDHDEHGGDEVDEDEIEARLRRELQRER